MFIIYQNVFSVGGDIILVFKIGVHFAAIMMSHALAAILFWRQMYSNVSDYSCLLLSSIIRT